ncbi:putative aldehyde dehydrogenase-like protein [Tolypocladium ophioglossoides CBS 100239]|uniref:Putative aldehyde dehydrogenase-like protein n=1 Tax=Tolypocladium ophioglossoides (strain CBS 100239) TaxID=1163406 RepID=A0A0L0NFY7_TOLOC|nr:putative aldehyde dehydrogenase-like protein [Tolypocladium ophioglossoides CBS 100239]
MRSLIASLEVSSSNIPFIHLDHRTPHTMATNLFQTLTAPNGVSFEQPLGLFINNEWRAAKSGNLITVPSSLGAGRLAVAVYPRSLISSPRNEQEIAKVHAGGEQDIDDSVKAARQAFRGPWSAISGTQRGELMRKLADLVEAKTDTFASIDTWNNGKRFASAQGDVSELTATLRYYAGFADKLALCLPPIPEVIPVNLEKLAYTSRDPIGVCGQIIPWNYPLGMAAWKLGPALAAGNTIVLKPAEQTPLSILVFATLIEKAGFPPGVINIVNGVGRTAGASLASHTGVDKIAFTGSTNTGREIMKLAAVNLKNISLETGGKSPLIVFEDAELSNAVKFSHYGIMANQGQICTATSRIFVHKKIYDQFINLFVEQVKKTSVVGDPFAPGTFQGPQVTKAQYDSVLSYIEAGKQEGATVAYGGKALTGVNGKGYFVEPTVFTNVSDSMKIYREEIFGPCAAVSSFSTEEEVIERANDTIYGLGAAIFTENISRALTVAKRIEAGSKFESSLTVYGYSYANPLFFCTVVWINSSQDSDIRIPFGGVKQSGIGRELGEAGIEAYTQVKAIHVNLAHRV